MVVLICILGGLLKNDRVASFRFLKRTPRRYRNSKKTLYGRQARNQRGGNRATAPPRNFHKRMYFLGAATSYIILPPPKISVGCGLDGRYCTLVGPCHRTNMGKSR